MTSASVLDRLFEAMPHDLPTGALFELPWKLHSSLHSSRMKAATWCVLSS